jgi:hypothetical protein
MDAMVTMRDALILIRLLAQMELLAPFSIEATTQGEILDFVAVWGDLLLGSIFNEERIVGTPVKPHHQSRSFVSRVPWRLW